MYEKKYLLMAINEAKKGVKKKHGGPFGAVLLVDGKIFKAHNMVLTDHDPTRHAEIRVISKACKKLKKEKLKNAVLYSSTEPCPMCLSAIHWAGIDTVYYSTEIEDADKAGFDEINLHADKIIKLAKLKMKVIGGLERKKGLEAFELLKKTKLKRY
ncbi:MAG: nucleoside deaminase [Candidatus ainarchaeum sp.]|nr:nucleoside deaminase [Candidatus ainarchaeum sp.]